MLSIPTNESSNKKYSVVSETYDLLSAMSANQQQTKQQNQTCQYYKDEWFLFRGSSNAPLREARIRSFKPILKSQFGFIDNSIYAELTIQPYVFDYDVDYLYSKSWFGDGFDLYNSLIESMNIGDMELKVSPSSKYQIRFDGNIRNFVSNCNDTIQGYFANFNNNGTFDFTDGIHHNYITNYNEAMRTIGIDNSSMTYPTGYSLLKFVPIRMGYFLFILTNDGGTTQKIAICKPNEVATATLYTFTHKFNLLKDIQAAALDKDCHDVAIIDDSHVFKFKNGECNVINNPHNSNDFIAIAGNDRQYLIISEYSGSVQYMYRIDGLELADVSPGSIGYSGKFSSIHGFGGNFIGGAYSLSDGLGPRLVIFPAGATDPEQFVDISVSIGMTNQQIDMIDVIFGLDEYYICFHPEVGDKLMYISYTFEIVEGQRVYSYNTEEATTGLNISALTHCGSYFLYSDQRTTGTEIYKTSKIGGSQELLTTLADYPNFGAVSGGFYHAYAMTDNYYREFGTETTDDHILTIDDFRRYYSYEPLLYKTPIIHLQIEDDNEFYGKFVIIPLQTKLLLFNINIMTSPLSLFYTSTYDELYNNLICLMNKYTYVNLKNVFIKQVPDYEDLIRKLFIQSNDYVLSLCSQFMNNVSQVIYTGLTEANVVYKRFDVLPSTNYITMYLKDNEDNKPTLTQLKDNYTRIIVEIDYIYEEV